MFCSLTTVYTTHSIMAAHVIGGTCWEEKAGMVHASYGLNI